MRFTPPLHLPSQPSQHKENECLGCLGLHTPSCVSQHVPFKIVFNPRDLSQWTGLSASVSNKHINAIYFCRLSHGVQLHMLKKQIYRPGRDLTIDGYKLIYGHCWFTGMKRQPTKCAVQCIRHNKPHMLHTPSYRMMGRLSLLK